MEYGNAENRMYSYSAVIASTYLFNYMQVPCRQLLNFPYNPLCQLSAGYKVDAECLNDGVGFSSKGPCTQLLQSFSLGPSGA